MADPQPLPPTVRLRVASRDIVAKWQRGKT